MSTKEDNSVLPNFFIIGAGKSGTTSLHEYCNMHPDIFMSQIKEPNFFEYMNLDSIAKHYPDKARYNKNYLKQSINNWADYLKLFKGANSEKIIGESSSGYFNGSEAAVNINRHIEKPKMLLILRNPIERLISRWAHIAQVTDHPIGKAPFERVFTENIWKERKDLISMGFYYTNLMKYYELFDKSQILIVFYEELRDKPQKLLKKIFRFLNVDDSFLPDKLMVFNVSGKPKNILINKLFGKKSRLLQFIRNRFSSLYTMLLKINFLQSLISKIRTSNTLKVTIPYEIKKKVYNEFYKNEISKLEDLLKVDLSRWKYES